MIVRKSKGTNSDKLFIITPQDADDLFILRRTITKGDKVIGETTRVIKNEKEHSRPDKGERIKVRIGIIVEKLNLDKSVDRLRVSGTISMSDNEMVPRGSFHSFNIKIRDTVTIEKSQSWREAEIKRLTNSGNTVYLLLAIDNQEAALCIVSGTTIKTLPNIYSGQSGKRYQQSSKIVASNTEQYFNEIEKMMVVICLDNENISEIIIFGPGETKRKFYNFALNNKIFKNKMRIVEGVDVAGEDGIHVFLRSQVIKEVMKSSKISQVVSIIEEIMRAINKSEKKFALGFNDVKYASNINAIESVIFSDNVFNYVSEDEVIDLLNSIESKNSTVYAVDSSTDIGLRVSSLGGIIALLRYAIL